MIPHSIADLVTDWGGFEKLIAQLHETGTVTVERDVILTGRSGAKRQIDVLVRHKEGLYEHLIVVECKYWNSRVKRLHVDALATTIREVGASRGVIFSTKGFQEGAATQARHENISLFKLREPTDSEWGLPGRHIEIWLQFVSVSLGNPQLPGAMAVALPQTEPFRLDIRMGDPANTSSTPIAAPGKPDKTLEELMERMAKSAVRTAYKPTRLDFGNGTFDGELHRVIKVKFEPEDPTLIFCGGKTLIAPRMEIDVGFKVTQKRLQFDRGAQFTFVLAVEDCVQSAVTMASRRVDETHTELAAAVAPHEPTEPVMPKSSILTVWIGPLVEFSEFEGVERPSGPEVNLAMEL